MRLKAFAVLLVLFSVVLVCAAQSEAEWVKFTSPEGKFSLLLPKEPKREIVSDPTPHSKLEATGDGYVFIVEYFENVTMTDPEKYLDEAQKDIVEALSTPLVRETKISLDSYPGRELEFEMTAQNGTKVLASTRIYAVNGSFYSMSFVRRADLDASAEMKTKYFSSIKFTPGKSKS